MFKNLESFYLKVTAFITAKQPYYFTIELFTLQKQDYNKIGMFKNLESFYLKVTAFITAKQPYYFTIEFFTSQKQDIKLLNIHFKIISKRSLL